MPLEVLRKVAALAAVIAVAPSAVALAQAQLRGPQWPVLPPNEQASEPDVTWTKAEVDAARARCQVVATQYRAAFEPVDPIRDGACGTPYPVRVTRIGKVSLSQPATVNCEVVAAVGDWMNRDVQALAKRILGGHVTQIEVLSSYACRNAYGLRHGRLSEHARANALDIKGFALGRDNVDVLADWGMTKGDIKDKIAAAEKAARRLAEAAAKAKLEARPRAVASASPPSAQQITLPEPSLAEQQVARHGIGLIPSTNGWSAFRGFAGQTARDGDDDERGAVFVWGAASRLGGPKAPEQGPVKRGQIMGQRPEDGISKLSVDANGHTPRQRFLREVYDSACKRFGTALGPEANQAHRNHLHIDLAERGAAGSYCR
ncbi:MAG: extensin family protein [Hyphomicrobiaceae bacterium]